MKKTIFLLLFTLVFRIYASSQSHPNLSIEGRVVELKGKVAITGASLVLTSDRDSVTYQITSDGKGMFRFGNLGQGNYKLMVRHIGYASLVIKPIIVSKEKVVLKDIELDESKDNQLREVTVVSGARYFDKQIDRLVVNVNGSIGNAGTNAAQVLENAPGVSIEESGSISLNGKPGVLVLIDGKPTHLAGADLLGYLKGLPSGTLDKLEIMSNPPARYSAAGGAGIIDIRTKKQKQDGFNGSLSTSFSQGRLPKTNNSIALNNKIGRFNFYANAGYSLAKNYFEVYRERLYDFSGPRESFDLIQNNSEQNNRQNFNYKVGIDYDITTNTSLGVMYNGFTSPYKERGNYLNSFYTKAGRLDSILDAASVLDSRSFNNTFNTSFIHKFDSLKNELSLNLDLLNYNLTSTQRISGTTLVNGNPTGSYLLNSENPFTTNIYSFQADFLRKIWGNGKFETGFQYTYSDRLNSGNYFNSSGDETIANLALNNVLNYKEHIRAAYINLRKSMGGLTIQAGLRIEGTRASANQESQAGSNKIDLDYTDLFPTIYFAYKLDKKSDHILDLSFGRRITRPDYQDLNPSIFFFDSNTSNKGNATLQPDYSLNYELNYSYKGKFTAGLFYNRTRNKIVRVYTQIGNAFTLVPINLDRVEVTGLTMNYRQTFFKWLTSNVYGEVTYSKYQGVVLGNETLTNSYTSTRFSVNNRFKLFKDWNAEISGLYRGSRILGQGIYKPIGQINAGIQKNVLAGNGTLSLNFRDIFHTWNVRRSLSIPSLDVYSTNVNDTQQIGISFSYRFGKSAPTRARKNAIQSEAGRAGAN